MESNHHPKLKAALDAAKDARGKSYAPYSKFYMGASVVTDAGEIVVGSLVENISFGLAMCAERVGLFSAVATAAGKPELLVLVSKRTGKDLTWPCGACLQVALEMGGPQLLVVACDPDGVYEQRCISDIAPLLPYKEK
ncbi:MAG: cytidine deaminase [Gammaproteobacteria bacterium]